MFSESVVSLARFQSPVITGKIVAIFGPGEAPLAGGPILVKCQLRAKGPGRGLPSLGNPARQRARCRFYDWHGLDIEDPEGDSMVDVGAGFMEGRESTDVVLVFWHSVPLGAVSVQVDLTINGAHVRTPRVRISRMKSAGNLQ
jgi:hypothetical protein